MGILDFLFGLDCDDRQVVWRNSQGVVTCPGNSCPKECDNSCPIYLNTQGLMFVSIDKPDLAISLYKKAIEIAPDFYDVWNNLGAAYGSMGNYQKAYEHYLKARELNKQKPHPVFGLMLTSRDLGRFEECLKWCDVYQTLSKDGREKPIREKANAMLGLHVKIPYKSNRF